MLSQSASDRVRSRYRFFDATIEGGIRGGETVAGEAGGLPLDTRNSLALRGAGQYCIPLWAQYQQSSVPTALSTICVTIIILFIKPTPYTWELPR